MKLALIAILSAFAMSCVSPELESAPSTAPKAESCGEQAATASQGDSELETRIRAKTSDILSLAKRARVGEEPLALADEARLGIESRARMLEAYSVARPDRVASLAVDASDLDVFGAEATRCLEVDAEATGFLEVRSSLPSGGAREQAEFSLRRGPDSRRRRLSLVEPVGLPLGSKVKARGLTLPCSADPDRIIVGSGDLLVVAEGLRMALSPVGTQSVAVILVNLVDQANPWSPAAARSLVFGTVNDFMRENSQGRASLAGEVFGPVSVAVSSAVCDEDSIAVLAQEAVRSAGGELSAYPRKIYVFPKSACPWAGLGTVGGSESEAWINGYLDLHTVAHELGHNLGLRHSNALDCGEQSIGGSCASVEYGDSADVMGNTVPGHFNSYQKERLGWVGTADGSIQTITKSGRYYLDPYEREGPGAKALKILHSINAYSGIKTYLYLELRQPIGFDRVFSEWSNNLTLGVTMRLGEDREARSSHLIRANPALKNWLWGALLPGQSYEDPQGALKLKAVSLSSGQAAVDVEVGPVIPSPGCG